MDFMPTDIPPAPDDDVAGAPDPVGEFACEACGAALTYGGRGRHPRFCELHKPSRKAGAAAPRGSSGGVDAALARMDTLYAITATVLMMATPKLASDFESRIPAAQMTNRIAFESDPRLVKRINQTSQHAGLPLFIVGNVMLIGPTLRIYYDTLRAARLASITDTAPDNAASLFGTEFSG